MQTMQALKACSSSRLQCRKVPAFSERQAAACRPAPAVRPSLPVLQAGPDDKSSIINGPISLNTGVVNDVVSAVSEKATKMVDRSKGLWTRCDNCGAILYIKHLKEHHHICFGCNYHLKMSSAERIEHLIDPGTWRPFDETLSPVDPLEFSDMKAYTDRLKEAQAKTGLQDGIRTGTGLLHGIPVALGVMDFSFMGGSMGSVVGEKLTRLIEYATQEGLTLLIISTSGGARMQEGILSLMQMAKISAALHVHQNCAKLLYISILTSPTTGGVTASFGMLGDINLAEPQAIIGFAGRRVIEQTLQEQLPDDFQTAEYLLEKGLLDLVVPRSFLKGALFEMIDFYRAAPFKQRGAVPFGVQRGSYLAVEEKLRRKLQSWKEEGQKTKPLLAASESLVEQTDDVSYTDLVASFRMLFEEDDSHEVLTEANLKDAVALAKEGMVSWSAVETPVAKQEFKYAVAYASESA